SSAPGWTDSDSSAWAPRAVGALLAPRRRRLLPPPPAARAPLPQLPRHTASSHRLLCKRKDAFNRSPCWYRAQRFDAALKKLGSVQSLSSTENPGISLTAGDATPVGPLAQRYQVLARQAEPVTKLCGRGGA